MNKKIIKQTLLVILGQSIIGLGVSLFLYVNLGVDPLGVFHTGVANLFNTSYSIALFFESLIAIIFIYFVDKKYINIATVISLFWVSMTSPIYLKIIPFIIPINSPYFIRLIILILACLILAIGLNTYVLANLGVGPIDAIPEVISDKLNIKYQNVKVIFDFSALIIGYFIGGSVGIGTIISAFLVGPMIEHTRKIIKDPINNFIHID